MRLITTVRSAACCTILILALSLASVAQTGMNEFTIQGSIVNMTVPAKVYLIYDTLDYHPTDSAIVTNGKYSFRGSAGDLTRVTVSSVWFDRRFPQPGIRSTTTCAEVFVDKGAVQITSSGQMSNAVVTGSQPEKDFRIANKRQDQLIDSLRTIVKAAQASKNDVLMQLAMKRIYEIEPMMKEDYTAFVRSHPSSPIDLYLIRQLATYTSMADWMDTVAALYHHLPAGLRTSRNGRILGSWLDTELKTALGHHAPDFTQNDVQGHPVSLSSFKGKYVLLDFWASWDNNAAQALPILAKAGEEYRSKGLIVLGVSLDKDKDSWQQMIEDANAGSILHVSDLKGMENAVAQLYGVTQLPRNLLIDPSGIIIARNLSSLTLDKTLSSIFE